MKDLERATIKNRIASYPDHILDLLDTAIRKGQGSMSLLKLISLNYKGPLPAPSLQTMEKWKAARKSKIFDGTDRVLAAADAIAKLPPIPDLRGVNPTDKLGMLDAVVRVLAERVEINRQLQENLGDFKIEKALTEDLLAIKDVIQAQADLEEQFGTGRAMIDAALMIFIKHTSKVVSSAYAEVHEGQDVSKFKAVLGKHFDKMDLDIIVQEITDVLAKRGVVEPTEKSPVIH